MWNKGEVTNYFPNKRMVIKHVVFFIVKKSRRYLTELCLFDLAHLGWICLWLVMKKYMCDESETLTFFFLHSDNHDLFSLTFLQTSNIQWDFFVPLHRSFSTHGTVFEVNWRPPCWSKMRVKRGNKNVWEPLLQDQIHSTHCTESPSCSWVLEVSIVQRQ